MLRSANLESRQSHRRGECERDADAPLREFGIKAKLQRRGQHKSNGCSAPRIWNQGKARRTVGPLLVKMLRSANLESRQSLKQGDEVVGEDAPLREFGIKAKPSDRRQGPATGCSAPRIWNQGKALRMVSQSRPAMLRSANLESRQSTELDDALSTGDAPLREFGIKAKRPACTIPEK